ncbi:MAG TPA: hypothetical protein VH309_02480 [Elusimicrobiota bacterium]|jgi:hypothetical protein|nr:hypothetical protein [Elusimicrobiota bacterium]
MTVPAPAAPAPAVPAAPPAPAVPAVPAVPSAAAPVTSILGGELPKEGAAPAPNPSEQSQADKDAAVMAEADKKAALEKELEGKTDAEKAAILAKREADAKTAEKAAADKAAWDAHAPEKFADFKLPEGIAPDSEATNQFAALAKELDLSQPKAQKLVDFQAKLVARAQDADLQTHAKNIETWTEESKKMFGADWEKEFAVTSEAMERFGNAELKQLLTVTGLGSHPLMVKFVNSVGKSISEDGLREGSQRPAQKNDGELFYPEMSKAQKSGA